MLIVIVKILLKLKKSIRSKHASLHVLHACTKFTNIEAIIKKFLQKHSGPLKEIFQFSLAHGMKFMPTLTATIDSLLKENRF